jgi:hypothetical protein
MKNLIFILCIAMLASCQPQEQAAPEERSIGFATALPDLKWHIGTEDAIQIVKDLDKEWSARNYEALATFFADTAKFNFADGRTADSPAGFIAILKADDEGTEDTWTFDYAYSVDLNPEIGGEHVQAGFEGTSVKDSVETKTYYHESYYIIDGKVVTWNQFTMDGKKDE